MRAKWEPEELVELWTLVGDDWRLVANKSGPARLGVAVSLKFFEIEGRFPAHPQEIPPAAVAYVAAQVRVDVSEFGNYALDCPAAQYHRSEIRDALGFRPASRADEQRWTAWLAAELADAETDRNRLASMLLSRCREERVEPAPGQVERVITAASQRYEVSFCQRTVEQLGTAAARLETLLGDAQGHCDGLLAGLQDGPGRVDLEVLFREVDKLRTVHVLGLPSALEDDPGVVNLVGLFGEIDRLRAVQALGLPADLLGDAPQSLVELFRSRAVRASPSELLDLPQDVRLTLLAALCWTRRIEITDVLVDLLTGLIRKIDARAKRRMQRVLAKDPRQVRDKEGILLQLAEAVVDRPNATVRTAVYPVVSERTLRDLVREAKTDERTLQARRKRTVLRGTYSSHHRQVLAPVLGVLEFRCTNSARWPIMAALGELLGDNTTAWGKSRFYPTGQSIPIEGVVPKAWRDGVVDGHGRIERVSYEFCVLVSLCDALCNREIYVAGAHKWSNPDE